MSLRQIPAIDAIVKSLGETGLPRPLVTEIVRREVAAIRKSGVGPLEAEKVAERCRSAVARRGATRIQPVINATGIIIHTNLGRAPLASQAIAAMTAAAQGYSNLEYDLADGARGSRGGYAEQALALLCRAEAAAIVNNCAAALILILRSLAPSPPRNRVIILRGELVQIGGGFRVPEILEAAGAELLEVGTTNQTTLDDYHRALRDERAALVLKVHQSNFYMEGFVAAPPTEQIAAAAHDRGVPFIIDLGSGATFDTRSLGAGEREPTPAQELSHGADLVCFSGDKLLGGPQAGVIAGGNARVAALKKHPLFRALRCDKLILSALEATADALLRGDPNEVPAPRMMRTPVAELRRRAERIIAAIEPGLPAIGIGETYSQPGGGTLPRVQIPSISIDVHPTPAQSVTRLAERLRHGTPPIIGVIRDNVLKLDLRTVFPSEEAELIERLRTLRH